MAPGTRPWGPRRIPPRLASVEQVWRVSLRVPLQSRTQSPMAAARRRKPTDSEPTPSASKEAKEAKEAKELREPRELEEIEELETLEPLEDEEPAAPVKVTFGAAKEAGFETEIVVTVPELDKKAMPAAVAAPLRQCIAGAMAQVRYRKVLVRFAGDTLIGSAVRDVVGEVLREAKVVLGVVRRGYGDESVATGTAPRAEFVTRQEGAVTVVELTNQVAEEDLESVLLPELEKVASGLRGKDLANQAVRLELRGAKLAPAALERLRTGFSGATRLALGQDVLFDRELEAMVKVTRGKDGAEIAIQAGDAAKQLAALDFALRAADFAGQRVRVRAPAAGDALLGRVVSLASASKPTAIELVREVGPAELLWPGLLEVKAGDGRMLLIVRDGGRNRAAILAAFVHEIAGLGSKLRGAAITVDWPSGFDLDAQAEQQCITEALGKQKPGSVMCSFAANDREPFFPAPVAITTGSGGSKRVLLDTDAGKPTELLRAVERRLRRLASELKGKAVVVEVAGSVAPSRTLLRSLLTAVEGAGVTRLELDDHGTKDVLMPALLRITKEGAVLRIGSDPGGRDAGQVERALQRELDAAELALGEAFEIQPSPLTDTIVTAVIARGAQSVLRAGPNPVLVHPPLFATPVREGQQLEIRAEPGSELALVPAQVHHELPKLLAAQGDLAQVSVTLVWPGAEDPASEPVASVIAALIAARANRVLLARGERAAMQVHPEIVRQYVTVLGRRDGATPPMAMFGVEVGHGQAHLEQVSSRLAEHADLIADRRVLLVLRDGEQDRAARRDDEVIAAACALVEPKAAATLVFRGLDAQRRPCFEVVHSNLAGIVVGSKFADPRPRSTPT